MPDQNGPKRRQPKHLRTPRHRLPNRATARIRRVEKKWEPRLTAHSLAIGGILERIPSHDRVRLIGELSRLMRTPGALDFLTRQKSSTAGVFVRDVVRLFPKKSKLAEEYLFLLTQYYPAK